MVEEVAVHSCARSDIHTSLRACRQGARTKYNEGYRQLQRAMPAARAAANVLDLRPLLMAADWVHLKLLLYAIGSGQVTREHMAALAALWASHLLVFAAPIGASLPRSARDMRNAALTLPAWAPNVAEHRF